LKPFEDYKREVLLAYQKKKENSSLSLDLLNHTPASLKRECINVFPSRYCEKDKETFKSLFGSADSAQEYYQKIRATDPDIFRPLNNFLKGRILKTHERNVYLLAWLIDFEHEPLTTEPLPPIDPPDLIKRVLNWIRSRCKKISAVYSAMLAIVVGLYMWYIITKPGYMYWNGNEYKTLTYFQDPSGLVIIPLDTFRLRHLKKITDLKLITGKDVGKVYYSCIKSDCHFYTAKGENPEDTAKRLLPMTERIYLKYVVNSVKPNQ